LDSAQLMHLTRDFCLEAKKLWKKWVYNFHTPIAYLAPRYFSNSEYWNGQLTLTKFWPIKMYDGITFVQGRTYGWY